VGISEAPRADPSPSDSFWAVFLLTLAAYLPNCSSVLTAANELPTVASPGDVRPYDE